MRKGQVTAYIIIAVLLVIGAALLYANLPEEDINVQPILYPKEVEPVANFITQCAQTQGKEAVTLAASQGGLIEIPPFIKNENSAHLTLDEYGMQIIPYWTVPGQERIPPLDVIRSQLTTYVANTTQECFNNFDAFKEEYQIIPRAPLATETLLGNEEVVFRVTYPITIIHLPTQTEFLLDEYVAFVPIRLKRMYELAKQFMEFENDIHPIENTTMSLIVADPEIPTNGMELSCAPKQWLLSDVKERLQRSLSQNLQSVRIKNTAHPPFEMDASVYEGLRVAKRRMNQELEQGLQDIEDSPNYPTYTPGDAWEYFHTYYDIGARPTEMTLAIDYNPAYGMFLEGSPNKYGVLTTKEMKGASQWLQHICVNVYHFTYDVQYPVRVAIFDPVSNFGQGAMFQYAFPVLINDNDPNRAGLKPTIFPSTDPEIQYCEDFGDNVYEIRAKGYFAQGLPKSELKDVKIESICVNRKCEIGYTKAEDGIYRLRTTLPKCLNPIIRASKEGYISSEQQVQGRIVNVEMEKLRELNLKVVKHRYFSEAEFIDEEPLPLLDNEYVSIFFANDKHQFNQIKNYPQDKTIELIDDDATYNVRILINDDEFPVGGYMVDDLEITYQDLAGADTITLHVFEHSPYPRGSEGQEAMLRFLGSATYKDQLKPTFS